MCSSDLNTQSRASIAETTETLRGSRSTARSITEHPRTHAPITGGRGRMWKRRRSSARRAGRVEGKLSARSARRTKGREGGPGSRGSGFSNDLLRARGWKAPGGKPSREAATSRAAVERLGRQEGRRSRPSSGGRLTTTRVSKSLRSGAVENIVLPRARESSGQLRWERSPRHGELHRCERQPLPRERQRRSSRVAGRPEREPAARAAPEMESQHRSRSRAP